MQQPNICWLIKQWASLPDLYTALYTYSCISLSWPGSIPSRELFSGVTDCCSITLLITTLSPTVSYFDRYFVPNFPFKMLGVRHLQQLLMLDELLPKNQGATKEMISNNTSLQQYRKSDNHENDSCIICITDFEENEGIRYEDVSFVPYIVSAIEI